MFNPFRDRLMLHPFDSFRKLIAEINDLKTEFKKLSRRVNPSLEVLITYRPLKAIALPLNRIFKSRKYSQQRSIEMFTQALSKLHLLIQELKQSQCFSLAADFQHLYNRLFGLLPEGTAIQQPLFDTERYHRENPKPLTSKGFQMWLKYREGSYLTKIRYGCQRLAQNIASKPLVMVQPSLRLASC